MTEPLGYKVLEWDKTLTTIDQHWLSPFFNAYWPPGGYMLAHCPIHLSEAPVRECHCGIYLSVQPDSLYQEIMGFSNFLPMFERYEYSMIVCRAFPRIVVHSFGEGFVLRAATVKVVAAVDGFKHLYNSGSYFHVPTWSREQAEDEVRSHWGLFSKEEGL